MTIKFLSDSTINRIAAGEVIERPASVVKELVENSLDAGSKKIEIILEQAGKNLIIVSDDGIGMSKEDLSIAIERHTTSKLDEDDLLNIHTFGFRGEALPSIGAVSKMFISSRLKGSDRAYQIGLIGGGGKELKPAVHNEGTKIEVRDLFFATPARLKFLRTDRTELASIVDIVKKIALAHPAITISLTHDGKNIIKVRGHNQDLEDSLRQRITDIIGDDFIENSAYLDLKRPELSIYGYTSIPTFNRASGEDQFLFVNNRPIKDKLLQVALRVAYQDYLARDRYPVSVLFLQIDPQLVDVNVHPAKTEARFHDPNTIRGLFISAIKDALASKSNKVATNIATTSLGLFQSSVYPKTQLLASNTTNRVDDVPSNYRAGETMKLAAFSQPRLINTVPQAKVVDDYSEKLAHSHNPKVESHPEAAQKISINTQDFSGDLSVRESNDSALPNYNETYNFPLGAAKAQLHSTYIISQTEDSIIVVDQHAAHERLGYEQIKQMIAKDGLIKQRLLIPEIVELPDNSRAELLYDKKDELYKLGLSIEKFSDRSIIVTEVPHLLGDIDINKLIQDLADNLSEMGENISLIELIEHVTETFACHYSVRAGRTLSYNEMNDLLRQMENTPFSGQCNHGRPTYIELKLKDIEKLFGRR